MITYAVIAYIIGFVLVGILANKANRNVVGWILLSFIISPILAALILYLINPSEEFKKKTGLIYLFVLIAITGLFVGSMFLSSSSLKSHSNQLEIAKSSQSGSVCITSFEEGRRSDFKVQVQNNTDEEIKRIDFRVVYYDKDGNQIDYRDVSYPFSIDAHMTKTLEVHKDMDAPCEYGKATIKITDYSYVSSYQY